MSNSRAGGTGSSPDDRNRPSPVTNDDLHRSRVVCLIHYTANILVSFTANDWYHPPVTLKADHSTASLVLMVYASCVLWWRLSLASLPPTTSVFKDTVTASIMPSGVWYETCWLCNITLVLSSLALYRGRPQIAGAYLVAVGIDQLLWYVDLLGYVLSGRKKFLIGVTKYLFVESELPKSLPHGSFLAQLIPARVANAVTCTHHLWTIPFILYVTNGTAIVNQSSSDGVELFPLLLCFLLTMVNTTLSRLLTPFRSSVGELPACVHGDEKVLGKYMNVNLSHEVWRDVAWVPGFDIDSDHPNAVVYLLRLWSRWFVLEVLVFVVLRAAVLQFY
jgi:branched-subunit amino acid transport protein AzlD